MDTHVQARTFLEEFERRLDAVTNTAVEDLVGGRVCPDGGVKTAVFLTKEQRAMLVVFHEEYADYRAARAQFELLTPQDAKSQAFLKLASQEQRCQLIIDYFWLSVRTVLPDTASLYRDLGFDTEFQVWHGPSLRRELGDLRVTFSERSIRL